MGPWDLRPSGSWLYAFCFRTCRFLVWFLVCFESASGSKLTQAMQLPMSEFSNSVNRSWLVSGDLTATAVFFR